MKPSCVETCPHATEEAKRLLMHRLSYPASVAVSETKRLPFMTRTALVSARDYLLWLVEFQGIRKGAVSIVREAIDKAIAEDDGVTVASSATASSAPMKAMPLIKRLREQRDRCADALRNIESAAATVYINDNPTEQEWDALNEAGRDARSALEGVPTYEEQLQNIFKGLMDESAADLKEKLKPYEDGEAAGRNGLINVSDRKATDG
jgi:hypothetical protein